MKSQNRKAQSFRAARKSSVYDDWVPQVTREPAKEVKEGAFRVDRSG